MLLPYARRWTRGIDRDTESHHVLIPIRDQLDCMTEDQHVPVIPSWGTNHHVHDHRRRLGPEVLEMMDKYFRDWGNRHQSLAVEVNDGTSGAGYRLWYMRHGRLLIGRPTLEVDWQRDTTSASHGEEVSQIVKDTLLEAGIQFREPFFEGDPLFEHVGARGPRRGRMGHRGRARGRTRGRSAGGIPIPPDIEAHVRVDADNLHVHQFGTSDIMNLLHMSFDSYSRSTRDVEGIGHMSYESTIDVGDYIPDIAGISGTVRCDTEDTTIYNTQDFIEGLFDDPIESQGLSGQYFSPSSGLNCPK
uniref:Aminotransferase-like plant mobile domain-containing protein n=1 Tax=Solanum lycopersicum TaxID=4081 RepID=A0A3Q7GXI9_SOLLC